MRRNVDPQPTSGRNAGPAGPAFATAFTNAPGTPQRNGASLSNLIRSIEQEWQLGLDVHNQILSPSERTKELKGKVYYQIQGLYFRHYPLLEKALETFRQEARGSDPSERLGLLHKILKELTPKPSPRSGVPTPQDSQFRPTESLQSLRPSAAYDNNLLPRSSNLFQTRNNDDQNEPDPGSPTDVEEDDDNDAFVTPPSPTLSSRAAQRRVQQASPHARFAPGNTFRKRASDNSEDHAKSPKLTRTAKGEQSVDFPPDVGSSTMGARATLFKKPSLDMARSFQAAASMKSSANTSFADTSFNTMDSSQQTQPDTAATSFMSEAYDADVSHPKLIRISSTTMGSRDEQDLMNISAQLEREAADYERRRAQASQEQTRESLSTFGSIDEDGLLETSFPIEAEEHSVPPIPPLRLSDPPGNLRQGRSRTTAPLLPTSESMQNVSCLPPPSVQKDSPKRLPYYIREIPDQNLFIQEHLGNLRCFPYFILFICCRISVETGVTMRKLMNGMDIRTVQSSSESFWECVKKQAGPKAPFESPRVWSAAKYNFEGYTFKGRVVFNNLNNKPVFSLRLLPIQLDRSCRFQRKFGAHRFLYLDLPSFDRSGKTRPGRFTGDDMESIEMQWQKWFHKEHSFLGRQWRAFHHEPIKRKGGRARDDNSTHRIILFAIKGVGLSDISLGDMLNWFMPFKENMGQPFCKAYARFDLGLSRTIPTLIFRPSQLHRVKDILADGSPEDTRFNDMTLNWSETPNPGEIMNDGCSTMSVGAAQEIWRLYREATDTKNEPMPSVFQGRIGGAKGMWMVCGEPSSTDPEELEIWIEITTSQQKFVPHQEDDLDEDFDELRLTFELVNYSTKPTSSELHLSFIPILVDRGVPREKIANLMQERLDTERQELMTMLSSPVALYQWLHRQSQCITDEDMIWQAALPHSLPNKIALMLESGFLPEHEPYLASILCRYIRSRQILMERKLKVPLGKSAFMYGIPDRDGVLAPGEVHVDFSSPFVEETKGITYRTLGNMDILVARQPACRRSDIQKARVVKHPKLAHLPDVIIFSTRGQYPLAGKLQGGDYDGDIFWVCWEAELVQPFQNAPAPVREIDHEQYRIQKDSRKLHEVMSARDLSSADDLLKEVLDIRMAPSFLGMVTNFHERQAYRENRLSSMALDALCDLHDLLVDAPKNGYRFTQRDYNRFINHDIHAGNPRLPAYKKAMEDCEGAKEMGEADQIRVKNYRHNEDNVLDFLYFNVFRKHDVETLVTVKNAFPKDINDDLALQYPYLDLVKKGDSVVAAELKILVERLEKIGVQWGKDLWNNQKLTSELYNNVVDASYKSFRSLMPTSIDHPDVKPLLEPYLHHNFSIWESVRASALYTTLKTKHAFVWHMAGRELAKLKCTPLLGAKLVTGPIYANLKPKPIKVPRPEDEELDSDDDFESAVEQFTTL